MQDIQLRKAENKDLITLQKIGKLTFSETFASDNSEENLRSYLETAFSTEKVKGELSDENSEFYFAEFENEIIGYLKVNYGDSQTEIKSEKALEIERIYVLREFHGKKSDKYFMKKLLNWLQILSGWAFGNKTLERSASMKKMDSEHLTNIYSNWEMMSKLIL